MISEQTIIDFLFFFMHQIVNHLEYCGLLILLLTPKYNPLLPLISFTVIGVTLNNILANFFADNGLLSFAAFVTIFGITVTVFFKDALKIKIFAVLTVILYTLLVDMIFSAYTISTLGYYPFKVTPMTWAAVWYTIEADIFYAICSIPIIVIWNKKIKKYNPKSIGLFILFPAGQTIFIAACTYPTWFMESDFKVFDNPFMLLAVIISLISDVLMFTALRDNDNLYRTRSRVAEMEKQMELQLQYYDSLADKFTEIREYRHDINNLVSIAEALINDRSSESSKTFIGEMKEKALNMSVPLFCENSIVNAVLWKKQQEARESGLEFTAMVERAEVFPIDRIDLCSLLANLLDNAIREASKQQNGFVRVAIGRKHGLLILHVSNSTSREHHESKNYPKSTKNGDHGHGMEIAEKTAKKYNGKFVFKAHDGIANAIVSLITEKDPMQI